MGTTNLPEMAMSYETDNRIYGLTKNAINNERSAGGSSGGEASIIALRGSPIGII